MPFDHRDLHGVVDGKARDYGMGEDRDCVCGQGDGA
jgi:hypothetical protein